ncbi:MAG TPA: N-acetylmuramoyl-L-alanine amidase, partial [Luteimonas sp.]|nr:N-acetylmuramoyl-L-alanine amidase [Luteimonas sp.]
MPAPRGIVRRRFMGRPVRSIDHGRRREAAMARMWIVVGDTTSGGGSVVAGSPFTAVEGKPVARVGDAVVCSRHGPTTIASGDATTLIDGQALARQGDACACGCTLVAVAQQRAFIDPGAAQGAGAGASSAAASAGGGASPAVGNAARALGATPAAAQGAANDEDEPVPEVQAIELAPQVVDEDDNAVADSTTPQALGHRHPMVEQDPATNRIAHREVKIRVSSDNQPADAFKGRKVTWTMAPLFTAPGASAAAFRGDWAQAAQGHRDRFEASATFGANGFARSGQDSATTTVDAEGYSAIRVNLPPIGFNAARVSVQVEGMGEVTELIDLEVPAIVVIDPGHGGTSKLGGSSANNATSIGDAEGNRSLEKDLTLLFSRKLRTQLRQRRDDQSLMLQVVMVRDSDINVGIADRAHAARDRGADILFSIHFNGYSSASVHGPETLIEPTASGNVNYDEDRALATRIQAAMTATVPNAQQPGETGYRGIKVGTESGVYRDGNLGNSSQRGRPYSRACLAEIDFISNADVEQEIISGENADA